MAAGEHEAQVNGTRLWYKVGGAARPGRAPILYLAGGPGYNSFSFEKTIGAQLQRHVQMIYFDERGTGRSERPKSGDYSLATLVEDIEALRQQLGLPQLSLMGQSFGGTLALEYARTHPERVQKLILVDAGADFPSAFAYWESELKARDASEWSQAMATTDGQVLRAAERGSDPCALAKARFAVIWRVYGMPGSPAFHHWQQFHNQRFMREQDQLDAKSGLSNTGEMVKTLFAPGVPTLCYRFTAYDRLTMPVLVIEGKYDGAVPAEQLQILARSLPHAHYDEFENSAHFPYAEEPAKFERDVAAFVAAGP